MRGDMSAPRNWKFASSVVLPVLLAAAGAIAVIGIFMAWSAARNDDEALSRQANLVSHVLNDQRTIISREQEDVAAWSQSLAAVRDELDRDFIAENLGIGMFEYYGHDRAYVLDPGLDPVYTMRDGLTAEPAAYDSVRTTLEPLARRLREIDWQGALTAYASGASDTVPNITEIVTIEGQPAIVSLMPITARNAESGQAPGSEYIHITAEFLDAGMAGELTDLLLLENAHFTLSGDVPAGETAIAMRNQSGAPITWFAWTPDRPGARILSDMAPVMAGAVGLAVLIIATLVIQLRRSARALEAGRATAEHQAEHDALTGLGNRAKFDKRLADSIARIDDGDHVALLLLDLDRFKQVNDTLGHAAGDGLIQQVAARLQPLVRSTDTIVRLGGDEFAIIAENIGSENNIAALCERILKAIRMPYELGVGQAFVGVSIGVAITEDNDVDGNELARKADIALYEAKDAGRNVYRVFEEHMNEVVQQRQALEADLRAAMRTDDQLDVTFEPLVREDGAEVVGVEARIRWVHPTRGEIAHDQFMPVAETCGLVEIIGEYTLHQACLVGAKSPGQIVAVRAYAAQLRNPTYFDKVLAILDETGMAARDLELEIGETVLTAAEPAVSSALRKLRQTGVRIALNDFGTGFTSLRFLQQFNVDRIKIDRNFIDELAQSPDPEAITHAVIWLARATGVEVSADGVDDLAKKEFLARMGCMSFQGELFSPEGQADWLRVAANLERNTVRNTPPDEGYVDIELWDTGS